MGSVQIRRLGFVHSVDMTGGTCACTENRQGLSIDAPSDTRQFGQTILPARRRFDDRGPNLLRQIRDAGRWDRGQLAHIRKQSLEIGKTLCHPDESPVYGILNSLCQFHYPEAPRLTRAVREYASFLVEPGPPVRGSRKPASAHWVA